MLQFDTSLLDRSRNFNRAGAIGQNIGRTIKDIVAASRQRKKHGIAQQAFQGYNPQTDPEGINYRTRQKDYYNALRGDWRTSDEGHQGLQAVQQQEIEDRNRRVQEERNRLALDSNRIQNKLKMIQYDQLKNDMLDETLTHMAQSPEKYEAGMSELQKYFPVESQQLGLPGQFNKDAQAKILMRRGVSKKTKALNDMKLQELLALEDRARKVEVQDRDYQLRKRAQDITEKRYQQDYDAKMAKAPKATQIKLSAAEKNDLGTIAKSVEAFNAVSDMFKSNDLSGLKAVGPGMVSKIPIVGGKLQPEQYEYEKLKRRLAEDALRDATGAAAPAHEVRTYMAFFPDVGDTEREAQAKIEGMKVYLRGKGEKVALGLEASGNKEGAQQIRSIYDDRINSIRDIYSPEERIEEDDQGNRYRFLGGDDKDEKNWELIR